MTTDDAAPGSTSVGDWAILARVRRQVRPHSGSLALLVVLELISAPLYLLAPVPLKVAIDSVIGDDALPSWLALLVPDGLEGTSDDLLLVVIVLQIVIVLLIQLRNASSLVLQRRTEQRLTVGLRESLFRHIQQLSFTWLDRRGTADSIYRVQYDTPAIANLTIHGVIPLMGAGVTLVAMTYVLAQIDLSLALVALAVAPLILLLMAGYRLRMRDEYREAKMLESSALHEVQETFGAFRVVKVFGREDEHARRFRHRADTSIRANVRLAVAEGFYGLAIQMVIGLGTVAVLYLGVRSVRSNTLTVGDLTLVMAYLAALFAPVKAISEISASLQGQFASLQRVFEVVDEEPTVADRPDARPLSRAEGTIDVQDVAFAYDESDIVLSDISFSVPPGARVGIVGPTGAGKTTLIGLLTRLHDPDRGRITLDGTDLRDYRLADLRDQFAVVLQDSVLFSVSIGENIGYGRDGASAAEIEEAARAAGAHEFISELPEGYDTVVGERGMRLSGGERQRVALARAFLRDAPILVLDEPTSSVDQDTEAEIMSAMVRLMAGRTTFMIAHRLSTLDVCDRLLRVKGGTVHQVVESDPVAVAVSGEATATAVDQRTTRGPQRAGTTTGPAAPPPPTDEELSEGLEHVLGSGQGSGDRAGSAPVTVVERRPDPYVEPGTAELVTVQRYGRQLDLRVTYSVRSLPANWRAGEVHRIVLEGHQLLLPKLHGTYEEEEQGRLWIVTEHPHGAWRLDEVATLHAMQTAARWLADFHRTWEISSIADLPDLRRRRAEHLVDTADEVTRLARAQGVGTDWLPRLSRVFIDAVPDLLRPPLTVILGAAYPANLLVHDGHVLPIDVGAAEVAVGELDLAELVDGWSEEVVDGVQGVYRRARWPDGPATWFASRLEWARVLVHLERLVEVNDWQRASARWRLNHLYDLARDKGVVR